MNSEEERRGLGISRVQTYILPKQQNATFNGDFGDFTESLMDVESAVKWCKRRISKESEEKTKQILQKRAVNKYPAEKSSKRLRILN